MPLRYVEDGAAFDAEATQAMTAAFEQVCVALGLDGDARAREVVAVRIVELARSGVIDAGALRDRIMLESGTPLW